MMLGKIMCGLDERVPVLFVGPEGCRIAPRNSEPQTGEVMMDHTGLELLVYPKDVVRAIVKVFITGVESLGPDIPAELFTTWHGKKYRMIEEPE